MGVGSSGASSSWSMTQTALPYNNTIHRGADFCFGGLSCPAPSADVQDEFQLCLPAVMLTTRPADVVCILMKKTYNLNLCLDTNMICFSCSSCFCVTGRLLRFKESFCILHTQKWRLQRFQHHSSVEAINKKRLHYHFCPVSDVSTKLYPDIS